MPVILMSSVSSYLIAHAIGFVLKQLDKFGDSHDWEKTKAVAQEKISQFIPGSWFDETASTFVAALIECAHIFTQKGKPLTDICLELVQKDFKGALEKLLEILNSIVDDVTPDNTKDVIDKIEKLLPK